jgi:xanthine dehydrogenase accessory factor
MAGAEQFWSQAVRALEEGVSFALATVVNVRGSTPREVGAKMIVRPDGQFGTIGGGCGEAEVFRKARRMLDEGDEARVAEVDLTGDFDQDEIGSCGGLMDVLITRWTPERDLATARKLAEAVAQNRPAALLTVVSAPPQAQELVGTRVVGGPTPQGRLAEMLGLEAESAAEIAERTAEAAGGLFDVDPCSGLKRASRISTGVPAQLFLDPVVGAQRLIIAGAGHIAQPLAVLGSLLGLRVTVIDDRGAFANRERFATADEIIVRPFAAAIESLALDAYSYLVSVTRGHAFDYEVVRAALKQPCGFVGLIASRRRARAMLERLAEDGVPAERLEQVHAPLGVDIGAETPEEIALAIMAEIVRERRTGARDVFNLGAKYGRLAARAAGHPVGTPAASLTTASAGTRARQPA